jgi:hypothetical protein
VKEIDGKSVVLSSVSSERQRPTKPGPDVKVLLNDKTEFLRETGFDAAPAKLTDVTKGQFVYVHTKKQGETLVATGVVLERFQDPDVQPPLGPPNRWEKLLQSKDLMAKQRAAYEQIAKLHAVKLEALDWGTIHIPSFTNSKLPTDLLYEMGFDILPMLAEALDDETPTATVITQREGDFKHVKRWKVRDFAALLIVRNAGRDFVIGEFPKELGIRDIEQRPKAAPEFRKVVLAYHSKFAGKSQMERVIADVTDPWFRNRFDAIIALGNGKSKQGRAPIAAHLDAFYADKNREFSSLTRAEMSHCSLALGQIGDKASMPQVRRVCKDMSCWLETYGPQGSAMLEDLFRSYQGLALLGEKDEAIKELERLFAAHGAKFEEHQKKEYAERLKAAKGEPPPKADGPNKGAAKELGENRIRDMVVVSGARFTAFHGAISARGGLT